MGLREQGIFTNRTLRKATLEEKGQGYLSALIIQNLKDLKTILETNESNGIRFFRMSSEIFPFHSHPVLGYSIESLPDAKIILALLFEIGTYASEHNHRLTSHPGPFNVLASPNQDVVNKTLMELECQSHIFDLMGLEPTVFNKINIHVGGAYGEPQNALDRFCSNFNLLSPNCKNRLTVENDDRESLYSVKALYKGIYKKIGIPIVFDYHHHNFKTGGLSEQDALELAIKTWPKDIIPVVHYSESKTLHAGEGRETPAHSDLVYGPMNHYHNSIDVMIEAKHKEKAIETLEMVNVV